MTKPKDPKDLLKRGRPSKIEGIDLEMLFRLVSMGLIDTDISYITGISIRTIYDLKKKYPEFSQAIKRGKEIADNRVEESLYKRAMGYSHEEDKIFLHEGKPVIVSTIKHYPPDTAALAIWLKNRRPEIWRDRFEVGLEVTPADKILEWLKAAGDSGVDAMFNNLNNKQEETMPCKGKPTKKKPPKKGRK